jgi:hypothetical protein
MKEELYYKDYRLVVSTSGPGWRVFIYAPGSSRSFNTMPHTRDKAAREVAIAEAKAVVDVHIRNPYAPM